MTGTATQVRTAAVPRGRGVHHAALDGLRGVAVISVLLYHGNVGWARGGFLGVDVFFVLSGFLITSLLVREHDTWGSIDLRGFWARRARRLLPALLLVLAAVSAYAALLADTTKLRGVRLDALATLAYVANWRLVVSGQSYFDQFGDPSPLRHMWSLGIEEQWYLVFPPLLVLLLRSRFVSRSLPWLLAAGAVASALWAASLYVPGHDPSRVYYGTDTRVQALLVGATLAVVVLRRTRTERPPTFLQVGPVELPLSLIGLLWPMAGLALLACLLFVDETAPLLYRGGFLAVALLSAAILGSAISPRPNVLQRGLSWRPLRHVGLVSYGLYLWHWPVYVALSAERTGLHGVPLLVVRVAVSVAAAELSYRLVEQPVRRGSLNARLRPPQVRLVTGTCVLACLGLVLGSTAGASPAAPSTSTVSGTTANAAAGDTRLFVAGDSVGFTLAYHYREHPVSGLAVDSSTQLGCGFVRGDRVVGSRVQAQEDKCTTWPQEWRAGIDRERPDVALLVSGAWEILDHRVAGKVLRVGTRAYEDYLDTELDTAVGVLGARGAKVLLADVPCFHEPAGDDQPGRSAVRNDPLRSLWLSQVYARYAAGHPAVGLFSLRSLLCPGGALVGRTAGVAVRYDGVHFSAQGAALAWRTLGPRLVSLGAPTRAYLVGDSVPYSLRVDQPARVSPRLALDGSTKLGCGLTTSARVVDGKLDQPREGCTAWTTSWRAGVATTPYDIGALFLGIGEQFDHEVDGVRLRFRSLAYAHYLAHEVDLDLAALASHGRLVALVTVPCHRISDSGSSENAAVINDDARIDWLNIWIRSYAASHKPRVPVLDLHDHLCPSDRYSNTRDGVTLRTDGLHFTGMGATKVWEWLGPQLTALASSGSAS